MAIHSPAKPNSLRAFLGRITRNTALDVFYKQTAAKRGDGQLDLAFKEIEDLIGAEDGVEQAFDADSFSEVVNGFFEKLPIEQRVIFLK